MPTFKGFPGFAKRDFGAMIPRFGAMARNEMALDEAKEVRPAGACSVTYGETPEEAQANALEAIELRLEVVREDGEPIPPPDRDLASPIDQLVPVAAADA